MLQKTKFEIVRFTRGRGLDIGRGGYKAFPHFVGVREDGDKTINPAEAADFSCPTFAEGLKSFEDASLDFVFCWGDIDLDTKELERILKGGGVYIKTAWHVEPTEDTAGQIAINFVRWTGSVWEPISTVPHRKANKSVCVCRYGAMGDMLQTASILPELKRQGYHVTINCHTDGRTILENDPNIDAFWTQERDQVPNGELLAYWDCMSKKFDRWINLNGTCEGPLLAVPGRENHRWPDAVRRKYMDTNYLEFMAEIAELPYHPEHHFYSTEAEDLAAEARLKPLADHLNKSFVIGQKYVDPFVVLWALAGSSVHKFWPHQDAVVARILLEIPNAVIVFVGDQTCKILEGGWEKEPRILCLSGETSVRESLAIAKQAQLVIGPETGVLNAVAYESMAKIVLLSHSSENNLTRDWVNTEGLHSDTTPCYPCHRLHYNRDFCPEDAETGAAMCQVQLHPSTVWDAVQRAYVGWGTIRSLITGARA